MGWRAVGNEMLAPGTLRSFQLPCVCGQSSACCMPVLGDTGLVRSHLFREAAAEDLMRTEGRGEEEPGYHRRAGLGCSAVAFGRVHGVRLRQNLLL